MHKFFACTQTCMSDKGPEAEGEYHSVDDADGAYQIKIIPTLSDNYSYLVINAGTNQAVVVDVGDAKAVHAAAQRLSVRIAGVLSTHYHADHTGGNLELLQLVPGLDVIAGEIDAERTPGVTKSVADGETFRVAGLPFVVIHTPSHTQGHVCFLLDAKDGQAPAVFTGDMLFVGGCGRFMEGRPQTAHASLQKLAMLDPSTRVFCGHEYTLGNFEYACSLEPENDALQEKLETVKGLSASRTPTVPSTIREELKLNPFLRVNDPGLQRATACNNPIETLAAVRRGKDTFTKTGMVITFFLDVKAFFSPPPE